MKELPVDFDGYSHLEKEKFFLRYYMEYMREGETGELYPFASSEVKEAYAAFLKEGKEE